MTVTCDTVRRAFGYGVPNCCDYCHTDKAFQRYSSLDHEPYAVCCKVQAFLSSKHIDPLSPTITHPALLRAIEEQDEH